MSIEAVTKNFGGIQALNGVDLQLPDGDVKCIIGPNGCGKSTLFNIISGALPPTSGRVEFAGEDITGLTPPIISRLGVGRKFQVPAVFGDMTVTENIEIAAAAAKRAYLPLSMLRRRPDRSDYDRLLADSGLGDYAGVVASELPHGIKQRLEIMMLVTTSARLLLLDEPTAGMTEAETAATVALIRDIRANLGVSILVIEHDMAFVRELDCPVVVMMKGAVLTEGAYDDIKDDPEIRRAYLGEPVAC
ncbi:ABC transporter ATP-binding protein [Oceanibacterium hippocampi]|uniref:ABC transporter ATP-binding protein n=1 Tax=Oceanibacterium hippocampi TaxID=745714 RepID=UPI001C38F935|nr:ABC transporter ATP-binding protein [Oceanibacterium hippocampi]